MVAPSTPLLSATGGEDIESMKRGQHENADLVEGFHIEDRSPVQSDRARRKSLLQQAAKTHLHQMVHQLVDRSLIIKASAKKQWAEVVVALASCACESVMPQVPLGDMMDIRPYVNVKAIPGGSVSESAYVAGVVARKQVAHKKMLRQIEEPRLMLLSG